jgi:hypothetical protein
VSMQYVTFELHSNDHRFTILRQVIPVVVFSIKSNNAIKYNPTHLFIKYFRNLQLSATCFGFLEPSSG